MSNLPLDRGSPHKMTEFLLADHRAIIAQRWLDLAASTLPGDFASARHDAHDPFANPVAHLLRNCIDALVHALDVGVWAESIEPPLEAFLKFQALQSAPPSDSLRFLLAVKPLLREEYPVHSGERDTLTSRLDDIVLLAFDIYVRCREKVFEARTNQIRRLHHVVVERGLRSLAQNSVETSEDASAPFSVTVAAPLT